MDSLLRAASYIVKLDTLSSAHCVIRLSVVVEVEVSLEPLHLLKVILVLGFDQLSYLRKS